MKANAIRVLRRRLGLAAGAVVGLLAAGMAFAQGADDVAVGQRIYEEGILSSGEPLVGVRFDNVVVRGREAACIGCHRKSGMGSVEGDLLVPPITGRFLYAKKGDHAWATMDPHVGKRFNQGHDPYTPETLAAAIRSGIDVMGKTMSVAMPHFALGDADMKPLLAYLNQLSGEWSPGVSDKRIRFATVVAPGVEPERRQAMLMTLRAVINQKNGSTLPGRRYMTTSAEMMLGTGRKWDLDIWELQGPANTWAAQLERRYREAPVFALVGGVSNGTWEPVHDFCQHNRVPCWFADVDLPKADQGPYAVYFSRGVALEADVLARRLEGLERRPKRIVQVYGDDYVGRGAAEALAKAASGFAHIDNRPVAAWSADELRRVMSGLRGDDVLVVWGRKPELAALRDVPVPQCASYFSGRLSGGERAPIPLAWKKNAHLVYPFELPEQRLGNMQNFRAWLASRNMQLIDEPLQAGAFFAMEFLADTVTNMLDNLYRDYLLERAEDMLSLMDTGKVEGRVRDRGMVRADRNRAVAIDPAVAEQELRDMGIIRPIPRIRIDHRPAAQVHAAAPLPAAMHAEQKSTTIYPRLSLGQHQRFASKGAYIVDFAGEQGERLVAESEWIAP